MTTTGLHGAHIAQRHGRRTIVFVPPPLVPLAAACLI